MWQIRVITGNGPFNKSGPIMSIISKKSKDLSQASVKLWCATIQFTAFPFCGLHVKPHRVRGVRKHHHLRLDLKLGHGKYAIWQKPYACVSCTNMLDKTRVPGLDHSQQPCYQPIFDFTYWYVLGYFDNWNIIQFKNKTTSSEDFDDVHMVVLDDISSNMESLVHTNKCGAIN